MADYVSNHNMCILLIYILRYRYRMPSSTCQPTQPNTSALPPSIGRIAIVFELNRHQQFQCATTVAVSCGFDPAIQSTLKVEVKTPKSPAKNTS